MVQNNNKISKISLSVLTAELVVTIIISKRIKRIKMISKPKNVNNKTNISSLKNNEKLIRFTLKKEEILYFLYGI